MLTVSWVYMTVFLEGFKVSFLYSVWSEGWTHLFHSWSVVLLDCILGFQGKSRLIQEPHVHLFWNELENQMSDIKCLLTYDSFGYYKETWCHAWNVLSLWSDFMLLPLNWPCSWQMHRLPCINCFWVNSFFLMVMKMFHSWDERFSQRKCFHCGVCTLIWWRSGTNVNLCLLCTEQASFTVYQGHRQPLFRVVHYLDLCASVSAHVMTVVSAMTSLLSDVLPGVKTENQ